ncbi:MAG TPA: iron chelate uptake ABC transporter family permease subunit, partial [Candidatus Deferrimicrobiaceae bacterium]|nr:iron chelate uptake ABC transporter family permease subunit [Candidatus Deferrimicrobiaceae bacterium]
MRRILPIHAGLLGAFLGAIALSVSTGPTDISLRHVVDALAENGWSGVAGDTGAKVVLTLRFPRALLGALVGGALSSSGVAFQALLRNPLADPYILGVSGGAAVGALAAFLLLPADSFLPLPLCAFLGAALAASAVFLIARRRSGVSRERLILMGVVVGAFLNALIMLLVALSPPGKIPGALYWLMGDLGLGTLPRVGVLLPYVAAGAGILFLLSRGLDLLLLGDEPAFTSGLPVEK